MVTGTSSHAGKSTLVAALCRILARRGVKVAPFKAQNMALNSAVTLDGLEIGRAQASQALAAKMAPLVQMNPVLLKPESDRTSQVVVMGRPWKTMDAAQYQISKEELLEVVVSAYEDLERSADFIVLEGAGSPAEINLLSVDIVNLGLAKRLDIPAILVGDIDRGGVFAHIFGTLKILPPELSELIRGFVINKFRGDVELLRPGISQLEELCHIPALGILPFSDLSGLAGEDSLSLPRSSIHTHGSENVQIKVISFPRISNFTDFDPLFLERGLDVSFVTSPAGLGGADLVILPGTKATVGDLRWLRERGLDQALLAHLQAGGFVLGICGGYQMLGESIQDDLESKEGYVAGLGLLRAVTNFIEQKVTRQRQGHGLIGRSESHRVHGYEIHQGIVTNLSESDWFQLFDSIEDPVGKMSREGAVSEDGRVMGTTLHGLFDSDPFRAHLLSYIANERDKVFDSSVSFADAVEQAYESLADLVEEHVAIDALLQIADERTGGKVDSRR